MEKEFTDLQLELRELGREIHHHKQNSRAVNAGDLFLPTMEGFAANTAAIFTDVEDLFQEMKKQVRSIVTIRYSSIQLI